jgi:hypothetical protein
LVLAEFDLMFLRRIQFGSQKEMILLLQAKLYHFFNVNFQVNAIIPAIHTGTNIATNIVSNVVIMFELDSK